MKEDSNQNGQNGTSDAMPADQPEGHRADTELDKLDELMGLRLSNWPEILAYLYSFLLLELGITSDQLDTSREPSAEVLTLINVWEGRMNYSAPENPPLSEKALSMSVHTGSSLFDATWQFQPTDAWFVNCRFDGQTGAETMCAKIRVLTGQDGEHNGDVVFASRSMPTLTRLLEEKAEEADGLLELYQHGKGGLLFLGEPEPIVIPIVEMSPALWPTRSDEQKNGAGETLYPVCRLSEFL